MAEGAYLVFKILLIFALLDRYDRSIGQRDRKRENHHRPSFEGEQRAIKTLSILVEDIK